MIGAGVPLATAAGYRELLEWARGLGRVRRAGVEGIGSFGAALCSYLLAQGVEGFEVHRPDRRERGESDLFDAQNPARAVLSGRARAQATSGDGPVRSARRYEFAKGSAAKSERALNHRRCLSCGPSPGDVLVGPGADDVGGSLRLSSGGQEMVCSFEGDEAPRVSCLAEDLSGVVDVDGVVGRRMQDE